MARTVPGVLAAFKHIDAACDAIQALRSQGRKNFTVYSAAPSHELEAALGIETSPVRLFTLIGGVTGVCAGLGMTYWMSLDWPLVVGGKPIATIPPYVVFMFELMVLLGSLSTVVGLIILPPSSRRPGWPTIPSSATIRSASSSHAAGRKRPRSSACSSRRARWRCGMRRSRLFALSLLALTAGCDYWYNDVPLPGRRDAPRSLVRRDDQAAIGASVSARRYPPEHRRGDSSDHRWRG